IRDATVTEVQTCALPICGRSLVWLYAPGLAAGLAQLWMFRHAYAGLLFLNRAVFLAIAAASLVGMASVAVAAVRGGTPLARRRAGRPRRGGGRSLAGRRG